MVWGVVPADAPGGPDRGCTQYNYVNGTSDGHVNKISMQNMEKDPFLK